MNLFTNKLCAGFNLLVLPVLNVFNFITKCLCYKQLLFLTVLFVVELCVCLHIIVDYGNFIYYPKFNTLVPLHTTVLPAPTA